MLRFLAALPVLLSLLSARAPAADQSPRCVYTRQNVFYIPFQIPETKDPASAPAEVWLYVSEDAGKSWQPYRTAMPEDGRFLFRTSGDGQFWFLVLTKDVSGTVRPQGPPRPQMRVVVDTSTPEIKLEARRGPSGEVTAQWEIADANLEPGSMRLEYRVAGSEGPWRAVEAERITPPQSSRLWQGSTSWMSDVRSKEAIEVRIEVTDAAENPAVHRSRALLAEAVAPIYGSAHVARLSQPPAMPEEKPQSAPWAAEDSRGVLATSPRHYPLSYPQTEVRPGGEDGHESVAQDPTTRDPFATPQRRAATHSPVSATTIYPRAGRNQAAPLAEVSPFYQHVSSSIDPTTNNTGGSARNRRWVNSRLFAIDYDLPLPARDARGRIELWGTPDSGRTWRLYGIDDDGRTPVTAHVESEGSYGFRVIARRLDRAGEQPPGAGDEPDMWVTVDKTPPRAHLFGAKQGAGDRWHEVTLYWNARDAQLGPRPVTLQYSDQPTGPWTIIAAGLENTGDHLWQLTDGLPERLYLRLEVQDAAGNTTTHVADAPLEPNWPATPGRIKGVDRLNLPGGGEGRTSARPRVYRFE